MTPPEPASSETPPHSWAERFEAAEFPLRRENYRRTALIAIIFMLLGFSLDLMVFPEKSAEFLMVRLVCALLLGVLLWLMKYERSTIELRFIVHGVAVLPTASILWMIWRTGGGISDYYAGLNLVLMAASLLLRWPFQDSVINSCVVTFGYLAVALASDAPGYKIFNNTYFISVTAFFASTGTYFYNNLRFNEFKLYDEVERKRRELADNHAKLQALDEAKTRFFANVSHELRTPLTLILGPLEQMRRIPAIASSQRCTDLLVMLEENGLRLLRLINDLLDLVRLDGDAMPLNYARLDIAAFIAGMASSLRPTADLKRITFRAETFADNRPIGWMDRDRLEKILLNLAINAIKFTPRDGTILLTATVQGEELLLRVKDTGPGIKDNELPFVFERFWQADMTAKRKHGGVGIGLALVRTLTESLGGRIAVESREGQGTVFTVTVPWREEQQGESVPEMGRSVTPDEVEALHQKARVSGIIDTSDKIEATPESAFFAEAFATTPEARPTVLVADDEPGLRRYLVSSLEAYKVIEAHDGREALEMAKQYQPDIAILDYMMPELDGIELTRALRESSSTRRIPIVLVTANSENASRLKALEAGVNDFLTKPFSTVELEVRVRNLLVQAQFERDLAASKRDLEVAHQELKDNEAKLLQAERLSGLGRMSAGIIHEVNNPLNYTRTALHALKTFGKGMNKDDREEFEDMVKDANEGVDRVVRIVSDLRAFTRGSHMDLHPVELAPVLESARRLISDKLSNVTYECTIPEGLTVNGNDNQLSQVFVNLLQNAASFAPASLKRGEPPLVRVSAERTAGGMVIVHVWDNGCGIAPEDLGKLFDPFFTRRDVGEGMGLGLSICHQIMRSHGGEIQVHSEQGRYAEFSLCFPAWNTSITNPTREPLP